MQTLKIIFTLLLFQSFSLTAQKPMVAYRKEGIWHFFNTDGKSMWTPYADIANDPSGWVNGKLRGTGMEIEGTTPADISIVRGHVLYDIKGKIVFRPKVKYKYRILSGVDASGLVLLKNYDTESLVLCNQDGTVQYESPNAECRYLGSGIVAIPKNEYEAESGGDRTFTLFAVKKNQQIAEISCSSFVGNFDNGVIAYFDKTQHLALLNQAGKTVQPMGWKADMEELETQQSSGFMYLKKDGSETQTLFNKDGEILVSDISEVVYLENGFFQCQKVEKGNPAVHTYRLEAHQAVELNGDFDHYSRPTLDGNMAYQNVEQSATILCDKMLRPLATIKGAMVVLPVAHHFWVHAEGSNTYTCYNEKGAMTTTIAVQAIGKAAFGHIPVQQNGVWGLANESGKIVVKPSVTFKSVEAVSEVSDGYWCVAVPLTEENTRFDFYNFSGKKIFTTDSVKDGWDYFIPQENRQLYYTNF